MKNDFVLPIVVLTLICLVISAALAVTNGVTAPVIKTAADERAVAARRAVIDSEGFDPVPTAGMPSTVREVYLATNGRGYIFMLTAAGYGGDLTIVCGIDPEGSIISVKTLSAQNETKGMGSRVEEPEFEGQFTGRRGGDAFDTISGATITSKAYVGAVNDALAAFEIAKGAQ